MQLQEAIFGPLIIQSTYAIPVLPVESILRRSVDNNVQDSHRPEYLEMSADAAVHYRASPTMRQKGLAVSRSLYSFLNGMPVNPGLMSVPFCLLNSSIWALVTAADSGSILLIVVSLNFRIAIESGGCF